MNRSADRRSSIVLTQKEYFQTVVLGMLLFSASFLTLELGGGLTVSDVPLVLIAGVGLLSIRLVDRETERFSLYVGWCILLIFLGSALALVDDGLLTPDALALVQDGYILFLFAGIIIASCMLRVTRVHVEHGSLLALIAVVFHLLATTDDYRSSALFGNPNLAAHFVMVLSILVLSSRSRLVKGAGIVFGLAGLALSGSFSAIIGLAVAISYQFASWVWARHHRPGWLGGVIVSGAIAGSLVMSGALTAAVPKVDFSSSLNSDRFSRSGGLREQIWAAGISAWEHDPLGIGPQGFKRKSVFIVRNSDGVGGTEIHSDILGYLVERGPMALVGLLGFCWLLWRRGRSGGVTRGLLLAWAATAMTRETLHFRHLWIGFALALVADAAVGLAKKPAPAVDVPAGVGLRRPPKMVMS
jgi:hypothetical protein